ncbi:MAG: Alkaline phosphatase synthesis transcriptional regulatory protein PhoP [Anaerolineae bacterium]|nr:Alkaline phosphatase synthesis transcriptional regulatory protein PhoP [Anaerolineae bacterium]
MALRLKILIVEDSPVVTHLIVATIRRIWGTQADIYLAFNGEEGLQKALTHQPELIITDMEMPKMHGAEMARRLRQEPAGRNFTIMGMSGSDLGDAKILDNLAIFDAFMIKPFGRIELTNKLLILFPNIKSLQQV